MEAVSSVLTPSVTVGVNRPDALSGLQSQDFLRLLVTQLTQQDPLEPTDNSQILEQISTIRNIEMSSTLTDSLRSLVGQNRIASASSLIGQYVTSSPDESGAEVSGLVVGIEIDASGEPLLRLANGSIVPLHQLRAIEPALQAAERLIGQSVVGESHKSEGGVETVEGTVTNVQVDAQGQIMLELDSGNAIRLRNVISVVAAAV